MCMQLYKKVLPSVLLGMCGRPSLQEPVSGGVKPTGILSSGHLLARWRAWERAVRFVGVWGAFVVLTLFYLIPIIAIQGLINIDQLRKIRVIAIIIDLPVVRSIITAILPGTVLRDQR